MTSDLARPGRTGVPLRVSHRRRADRAPITLTGDIGVASSALLRDGIHLIDAGLAGVTFRDCAGVNAALTASRRAATAGAVLRLHCPDVRAGPVPPGRFSGGAGRPWRPGRAACGSVW
ncbi:STAS domain-containing protein [Streptomyces johnsoniae]|uniref:STAS domain-containing protein n=1 Tax=Streptomyces johnsoniae TaxID=3075532 RepID=A0ABU2RXP6_9ACTN|nr:hypothetical protein [Streptomyces sp. DSM 41886]MDT0441211.1 hypothetical protein [Streptomyces sp. DSM 41886]